MTHRISKTPNRVVEVPSLARVEGEGALHIRIRGTTIEDLRLEIYEPPRFFEALGTSARSPTSCPGSAGSAPSPTR